MAYNLEEINKIKTWKDLVIYQREHGFKFFWCLHKARALNIPIPAQYRSLTRKLHRS